MGLALPADAMASDSTKLLSDLLAVAVEMAPVSWSAKYKGGRVVSLPV
jgi:hypothetical protein